MNSLQLLVIDLGAYCVVKVEQADGSDFRCPIISPAKLTEYVEAKLTTNNTFVIRNSFDQLKAALDDAPVPRIERRDDDKYSLIEDEGIPVEHICQRSVAVIETVIGRPLPIWAGGKWEQLYPCEWNNGPMGNPVMANFVLDKVNAALPFKAWRYTR